MTATPLLKAENLHKSFTLYTQGGIRLPVLEDVSLQVYPGECVGLAGASGSGKSTLMRCLYANYRVDQGSIWVQHLSHWVNLVQADPGELLAIRSQTIGYVSQFLRVIPRVPALDIVMEPVLEQGQDWVKAKEAACQILRELHVGKHLWSVSPTTFSGGEKQRISIARTLLMQTPILLLDEPTSALDAVNSQVVINLIKARKAAGCAVVGIFHNLEVRQQVCDREFVLTGRE